MRLKPKTLFYTVSLIAWGITASMMISQLHSYHLISFFPNKDLIDKKEGQVSVTHVLGTGCRCSESVTKHLLNRGTKLGVVESVVYLSEPGNEKLESLRLKFEEKGFQFQFRDKDSFSEYENKVTGVPFLMVSNRDNQVLYAGGYGRYKIIDGQEIQDEIIINKILSNKSVENLPIFGCATSLKYQSLLDPFQIKYTQGEK